MYEISDQLHNYLLQLKKTALLNVMLEAIDEMQTYNGRSITQCIALAVGAEETEEGKYKFPSTTHVNKNH